jgi:hypothetical protein
MIRDLDRTIEELLRRELSAALVEQVAISFAPPDNEFPPPDVKTPAVNLFLYDIRENTDLREGQWALERRADGSAYRIRNSVRVDCSYLITAWSSEGATSRWLEEHHLLSEVMRALLRHPTIPGVLLRGGLLGQEPPLPASTLQPGRLQSPAEFWQALGGKPKAALHYTVTIGVVPDGEFPAEAPVIEKVLKFPSETPEEALAKGSR